MSNATDRSRFRELNDALRCRGQGGQFAVTRGIAALPATVQHAALLQLRRFAAFEADNDPHDEHDFGTLVIEGERLFFKIDSYDRSCRFHSPDPANPAVTYRVLTLMLADEY